MAFIDHAEAYQDFRAKVLEGIEKSFPIQGNLQTLTLNNLAVRDEGMHGDDIKGQHDAKVQGKTWAGAVYGDISLKDNKTGQDISRRTVRLANIPVVTKRRSFIIDGKEYQVDNQWQLKPGVYVKRRLSGELEAAFNIITRRRFDILFDPESKLFMMERGGSKAIALYPILKTLGIDDDQLEKTWGKDVFVANKNARGAGSALDKFFKADKRRAPKDAKEAEEHLIETLKQSKLRPDATELTLGKPFTHVTGDSLRLASQKLLAIHSGAPEDDRDSLIFKDLRTAGDFVHDIILDANTQRSIRGKISRKMRDAKDVRDLIRFDMFNEPVKQAFTKNSAARTALQINPIEMLAGANQTTVTGPGGIQSQNAVDRMVGLKYINPSHMGFLDPVRTPESGKSGIVLQLPLGVVKKDKNPVVSLYNLKTNRFEQITPAKFSESTVVLPDQIEWKNNKPVPKGPGKVKASKPGNEVAEVSFSSADYVLRHPSSLFGITTNLIPFLGNNSGNRATYAGQHIEQAISLTSREAPLVQVSTGSSREGLRSFESLFGRQIAHEAPADGKVVQVTKDKIVIDTKQGKQEVHLYNNFPLNDPKALMHSFPLVKVGDKVSAGQVVADSNYTKNGVLALGTNLRVAYVPYKGYNFEDGVVISESAAKKLTSEHLHKPDISLEVGYVTNPKKFLLQNPDAFDKEQYKKLDEDGAIHVGEKVEKGDPLVVAMSPFQAKDRMSLHAIGRALSGRYIDKSLRWQSDHTGEVVAVHKAPGKTTVYVKTHEPMQIGDKISGRSGNKGIVTLILSDKEMPRTKDGEHSEVLLNPSGVPGRMNVGQVLETAAAKVSEKQGKPYIVENFSGEDHLAKAKRELKAHGLTDQEELFDPTTGLSLGNALVGKQYMLKLWHQIDKSGKHSARAGMAIAGLEGEPETYDSNLMPASGGSTGGKKIDPYTLYALLAHGSGARVNIREAQTYKSEGEDSLTSDPAKKWRSIHERVWTAIQTGEPLPPAKSTFAFQKFTDMLRAAGVNVEKKGHSFHLMPLTDAQVLKLSKGELKKPGEVVYPSIDAKTGDPKPKAGGLFDEKITGGMGGKSWSHIALAEPVPNPMFESAIRSILGMDQKSYMDLVQGKKALSKTNKEVELDTPGSVTGGQAIVNLLQDIDVQKELASAKKELSNTEVPTNYAHRTATPKIDKLVKKIKYLRALEQARVKPKDAYIIRNLPVIPPAMRNPSVLNDGSVKWGDLNQLYQKFGTINTAMKDPSQHKLGDDQKIDLRTSLYDGVKALMGVGTAKDQIHHGILQQISGDPKTGYFQNVLMSRRQDLSMRSTIVPEPGLGLDEVGLPRQLALHMLKPFVIRKLVEMGAAAHALEARKMVQEDKPVIYRALDRVAEERPILLKRDPTLHKHSVLAFMPKIVSGKAIQIHPLVTTSFNADFDGDQMTAYAPISREAIEEARKMLPSSNLYDDASGRVMFTPTLESALGIYKLSRKGTETGKKFTSPLEIIQAVNSKKLGINDVVTLRDTKTTLGRILLASAIPEPMQQEILTSVDKPLDKRGLSELFKNLAKNHRGEFGNSANKLKDLGFGAAYGAVPIFHGLKGPDAISLAERPKDLKYVSIPTHSLSLSDFEPDKETRDRVLGAAERQVAEINRSSIPKREKDRRTAEVWVNASKKMDEQHFKKIEKNPSNLALMLKAGVKPSDFQYKQLVLAPVLMADALGNPILTPIKKSYSEGLDVASYWIQQQGARRGTVMKVQEVSGPGTFTKHMIQTTMNMLVTADDCGTNRGISLPVTDKSIHDRYLAHDVDVKDVHFSAGTLLTPEVVDRIKAADKNASIVVRSPLKCELAEGLCKKCIGLQPEGDHYPTGANIGILASQALGERSTQLTLKSFHSGGVVQSTARSRAVDDFDRVQQLTDLTENIPNSATLAMHSGKIEKIEKDPTGVVIWIGGIRHHVGKDRSGAPLHEPLPLAHTIAGYKTWHAPKQGMTIRAGETLSDPNRTFVNPRDLYRATNDMEAVQNFLVNEIHGIYGDDVRRQHVETVVRAMGNLTKIRDPGDAEGILRGEFQSAARVRAINRELIKQGKRPIEHSPVLKGIDNLPLAVQEDWMAKLQHNKLKQTLLDAAGTGATSNIHGLHPVPAIAYGAEIGLNKSHSKRPGLEHLKDVAEYAY